MQASNDISSMYSIPGLFAQANELREKIKADLEQKNNSFQDKKLYVACQNSFENFSDIYVFLTVYEVSSFKQKINKRAPMKPESIPDSYALFIARLHMVEEKLKEKINLEISLYGHQQAIDKEATIFTNFKTEYKNSPHIDAISEPGRFHFHEKEGDKKSLDNIASILETTVSVTIAEDLYKSRLEADIIGRFSCLSSSSSEDNVKFFVQRELLRETIEYLKNAEKEIFYKLYLKAWLKQYNNHTSHSLYLNYYDDNLKWYKECYIHSKYLYTDSTFREHKPISLQEISKSKQQQNLDKKLNQQLENNILNKKRKDPLDLEKTISAFKSILDDPDINYKDFKLEMESIWKDFFERINNFEFSLGDNRDAKIFRNESKEIYEAIYNKQLQQFKMLDGEEDSINSHILNLKNCATDFLNAPKKIQIQNVESIPVFAPVTTPTPTPTPTPAPAPTATPSPSGSNIFKGSLIGGGVGLVVGLTLGFALLPFTGGMSVVFFALFFTMFGAGIGAAIGEKLDKRAAQSKKNNGNQNIGNSNADIIRELSQAPVSQPQVIITPIPTNSSSVPSTQTPGTMYSASATTDNRHSFPAPTPAPIQNLN